MSKKKSVIELAVPENILPSRTKAVEAVVREMYYSPGHVCSYCKGNGWFWGEERRERVKIDCPVCKGSGELDAVVTVEWKPSKTM